MQNDFLHKFGAAFAAMLLLLLSAQNGFSQDGGGAQLKADSAPAIVVQPADEQADYGANVAFTVRTSGVRAQYQWRKNGADLTDYGNVSGANTATLRLIGVAQIDAGRYSVVISNSAGSVTSATATLSVNPVVVFRDDFETGNLKEWRAFSELPGLKQALHQTAAQKKLNPISRGSLSPEATRLKNSTAQNHTADGRHSALLSSSDNKMYHNLGVEIAGPVRATFWIYDSGDQNRCYGELRGYSGAGHNLYSFPSGMKQLLAIGCYASSFGTNHTGSLKAEKANPKKYQAKVERGKNTGWFNLDNGPDRSVGWHKFVIERGADGTTVRFYVDDVLGRTIKAVDHVLLDCVTMGSIGGGTGAGNAWFDDITVEAFPWRYDWQAKDSTGKGLFDWMKQRETGEDPQVTDIGKITTVTEIKAANYKAALGVWGQEGQAIYATDLRGAVDYVFKVAAPDAYRIEIEGRERRGKMPAVKLPVNISVDGEYIGRYILHYDGKTNGLVHCFTPFLTTGEHTVRVYWDNAENRCSLYLDAIRLQSLEGVDLNNNGFKDWVENRVLAQCGIDPVPRSSRVSPACIEGRGQYFKFMDCRAGVTGSELQSVEVNRGAGQRWFANVPLAINRPTHIQVQYQKGVLEETADIEWEITNLLHAQDTVVRKGDSLLFNAVPDGETSGAVEIKIVGVANYVTDASTPMAHRFDQSGTFIITGTHLGSGQSGSITVKVVDAAIGNPIAAWVGKSRVWDMQNLPPEAVLEADPGLKLASITNEERLKDNPDLPPLGANGRSYSVITDAAEPRAVVARLGKNGPILSSAIVDGFRLFNWYDTYLRYVQIHKDGSQTIEEAVILSPMMKDVTVTIRIIVSGVTFDDGTLIKTLTAADFDELGITRVRYIRADGVKNTVCHTTKAFQNGVLVGFPGYEK